MIELWRACELVVPQNDPDRDIDRKLRVDPQLFLVGECGDAVVATVMGGYEGHRGWVNYLAVAPSRRGEGFGRVMMTAVESLLRERGCPKINLQVREGNREALGFYARLGYLDDHVVGLGKRIEHD